MTRTYTRTTERVPVEPLQRAFHESGLTLTQVCRRLGWITGKRKRNSADTARLSRALGLKPQTAHKARYVNRNLEMTNAYAIARAIGLDPHTVESWLPEPEPEAVPDTEHDACPECGGRETWVDSWNQRRCEACWAIVGRAA